MATNNRTRRKKKLSARAKRERARRVDSDASHRLAKPALAYHQIVFAELGAEVVPRIDAATLEPRTMRHGYWSSPERVGRRVGEDAWSLLDGYLGILEEAIAAIVARHSHYYWLHLYRRIGVGLHDALDNSRDARTTELVRNTLEKAFVRYGQLDDSRQDVALASEIPFEAVAGGLLLRGIDRATTATVARDAFIEAFRSTNQWVLVHFGPDDYVDIFRLEALAYEYWLTTARMRRVGKGGAIEVPVDGDVRSVGTGEAFERRIRNYDARIERSPFAATPIGVAFYTKPSLGALFGLVPTYNVEMRRWSELCPLPCAREQTELVTNFQIAPISLDAFARAHAFVNKAYRNKKGFELESLCGYLSAVGLVEYAAAEEKAGHARTAAFLQLYQRAYVVNRRDGYAEMLTEAAVGVMDAWLGAGQHRMREDAPLIHAALTCTPAAQKGAGLWSLGPRYLFFEHGPAIVVDLQGLAVLLTNAFFGVRYDQGAKGTPFEEALRGYVVAEGLNALPERILKSGSAEREVDVAVRCGDTLFLCECRAMDRPLDIERGKIATLDARTKEMAEKVDQAVSLARFIEATPKGANYDFSWAKQVVPLVVSPFVEWVWGDGADLWLDAETPRLLSAHEAIAVMKRALPFS